jgi:o-succinylbenzoate---CoA ligase
MQSEKMPNFLKKRAFLTPERTAVYYQEQTITFGELYQRSYQAAGQLEGVGVQKDQYVGVLLKNNLDTVVILFALQLLGVHSVILNNRLAPAELVWQLKDSKVASLLLDDSFSDTRAFINRQLPSLDMVTKGGLLTGITCEPDIQEEIGLSEVCTIMYTSGTTGNPKGVIQTYGNHWWSSVGSALNLGFMEGDCWLCNVPLFHISGFSILMRSVIYGIPIVLHDHFDAEDTINDIHDKKVTIMSVVGTALGRIVDALQDRRLIIFAVCFLEEDPRHYNYYKRV